MVSMDAFASAFGFDAKSDDVWTTLGKVTAISADGKLSVLLGGSATPAECEAYCVADVGDVVFVAISKGVARAIARRGGDGDGGEYLPITGGTLTGELEITRPSDGSGRIYLGDHTTGQRNGIIVNGGGTREGWAFSTISGSNSNGDAVLMGDGGMVVVGSGESAMNLYDELVSGEAPEGTFAPETEQTFIASDGSIYFESSCNTIGNRNPMIYDTSGNLLQQSFGVDLSQSNNGVSADQYRNFGWKDKNGYYAGFLERVAYANGEVRLNIGARNRVNNANVDNTLRLIVKKDGTRQVVFTEPLVWQKALGLAQSSSYSTYFTPASGITVNWFGYSSWGKVVCVVMSWKSSSAISVPADGNITDKDIGTFASSIRPPMEIHGVSSGDPQCWYWFGTNGVLKVGAFEGNGAARTIAANTNIDFYATWVLTS